MRAWAWFSSTWTLRLLERRFSSNIYIVSRLLDMASFITQHISLSFVALAKDVERSQLALLFSLFPYRILKVLYTEPISSTHLTRGGLGVSSMFILISSIKSWYHGLSGFSMLPDISNCRFHPVEKPLSDTTKPTWEIYLYNFLPRSTICQGFLVKWTDRIFKYFYDVGLQLTFSLSILGLF